MTPETHITASISVIGFPSDHCVQSRYILLEYADGAFTYRGASTDFNLAKQTSQALNWLVLLNPFFEGEEK